MHTPGSWGVSQGMAEADCCPKPGRKGCGWGEVRTEWQARGAAVSILEGKCAREAHGLAGMKYKPEPVPVLRLRVAPCGRTRHQVSRSCTVCSVRKTEEEASEWLAWTPNTL